MAPAAPALLEQPEGVCQAGVLQGALHLCQDRGQTLHVSACLCHELLCVQRVRSQRTGDIFLLEGHRRSPFYPRLLRQYIFEMAGALSASTP
jgi:hypothetical protein